MKRIVHAACVFLGLGVGQAEAGASASFDCTHAATSIEHLTCESDALAALDGQIADAFRATRETNDDAVKAARLREQRQWLQGRFSTCGVPMTGAIAPGQTEAATACLVKLYAERVGALRAETASPAASGPSAAAFDRSLFPAIGENRAILTVPTFGRYAVLVKSDRGTALQVVDAADGPGYTQGSAGHADGRVDSFFDQGRYLVKLSADPHGTGDAELSVLPSVELNPDPQQLVELKPVDTELGDHQQRSYWLNVTSRRAVAIEASGRYLDDLRLWRDGKWLVDATPGARVSDAVSGQPLGVRQLSTVLEPGLYRVTAYGDQGQQWANGSDARPLHIRYGIPVLASAGRISQTASATGTDRFLVPPSATYFRLDIDKPEKAALAVQSYDEGDNPYVGGSNRAGIDKTNRDPYAEVSIGARDKGSTVVTVEREPGAAYRLTWFDDRTYRQMVNLPNPARGWVALFNSGNEADQLDPTLVVTDPNNKVIGSTAISLDHRASWQRRFNLLDETTLFLHATEAVDLTVEGSGASANFRINPLVPAKDEGPRSYQESGYVWQLNPGFYVLSMVPRDKGKGILTLSLHPQGTPAPTAESPHIAAAMLEVPFPKPGNYLVQGNRQANVHAGLRLYNSPIDLAGGITFAMTGAQTLSLPVITRAAGDVTARTDDGIGVPLSVDGAAAQSIAAGAHTLALTLPGGDPRYVSVSFTPEGQRAEAPLPPLDPKLLAGLPDFPKLAEDSPRFLTLARTQQATFALSVDKPALYSLQSTGLIETQGKLRTRVVANLDEETADGTGRNFLIQRYLGQGDYQLTVDAPSASHGPVGVLLTTSTIVDRGTLVQDQWSRATLPPGQGVAYGFHVGTEGIYALKTLGLGREFAMRLEDADGWPVLTPGGPADVTLKLAPGGYRMILLPNAVESRAVTLLHRVEPAAGRSGHGPFAVEIGKGEANRWMEPDAGQDRVPDRWTVSLPAEASVTIALDAGMQGTIAGPGDSAGRMVLPGRPWTGTLSKGEYEIDAVSAQPNNRVDYTLNVTTAELLAGQVRDVTAPVEIPVSVGEDAPFEINSYGASDVRARLYDASGALVGANDDRENDWNFSIATRLTPGKYRLKVDPVGTDSAQTQVAVERPAEVRDGPAALDKPVTIADALLHVLPIDAATLTPGSLVVVSAEATGPVGLSLEQSVGGEWQGVGGNSGTDPFLGLPVGDTPAPLRLRVWSRDHTAHPIAVTVSDTMPKTVDEAAMARGVALSPLVAFGNRVAALHVTRRDRGVVFASGSGAGLQWSTAPGVATAGSSTGQIGGDHRDIWLLDKTLPDAAPVTLHGPELKAGSIPLTVPASGHGVVVSAPPVAEGTAVLWRVESRGTGQAAVSIKPDDAGLLGFGGPESARVGIAVGLSGSGDARLWQPEQTGRMPDLPVTLSRFAFKLPAPRPLEGDTTDATFAGSDAARYMLAVGDKLLSLDLPDGTAAVLTQQGVAQSVIWAWRSRVVEVPTSADGLVLLYTGRSGAPYSIGLSSGWAPGAIRHDNPGTLVLDAPSGGIVAALGAVEDFTLVSGQGAVLDRNRVQQTSSQGMMQAVIDYRPGLMSLALGLEATLGADAKVVDLPAGPAQSMPIQSLRIAAGPARLVRVRASVPAIFYTGADDDEHFQPRIRPQLMDTSSDYFVMLPEGKAVDLMAVPETADGHGDMVFSVVPTTPVGDGIGPARRLAPGEARAFSFALAEARQIGAGVRGTPDIADVAIVGADGSRTSGGKLMMPTLPPGTSYLVVSAPDGGPPVEVEPVLVNTVPPDRGPPPDVKAQYLALIKNKEKP